MKKKKRLSKHHIIPRSRGGNSESFNIVLVEKKEHQYYHALFENRTPDEIIVFLVNHFWNGQKHWLIKALFKLKGG